MNDEFRWRSSALCRLRQSNESNSGESYNSPTLVESTYVKEDTASNEVYSKGKKEAAHTRVECQSHYTNQYEVKQARSKLHQQQLVAHAGTRIMMKLTPSAKYHPVLSHSLGVKQQNSQHGG
jgi:hypothetical protein